MATYQQPTSKVTTPPSAHISIFTSSTTNINDEDIPISRRPSIFPQNHSTQAVTTVVSTKSAYDRFVAGIDIMIVGLLFLIQFLFDMPFYPASRLIFHYFRYTSNTSDMENQQSEDWDAKLKDLMHMWKEMQAGAFPLIFGPILSIFTQPAVYTSVLGRTSSFTAVFLALLSFSTSFFLVLHKRDFVNSRSQWKAAKTADDMFWKTLSLPFAFAMWALILFISTLIMLLLAPLLSNEQPVIGLNTTTLCISFVAYIGLLSVLQLMIAVWQFKDNFGDRAQSI